MDKKRWLGYLAWGAALTFNNWLLGTFLNWRLFSSGGSVSEFSALDQPHHWVFRVLDIISGILLCLLAGLMIKISPKIRYWRWMAAGFLVLGLGNCLDAILPLPCSGTVDAACSAPVRISFQRVSLPDHVFSSVIIGVCYVLIPLAVYWRSKRQARRHGQLLGLMVLAATILFFGLLIIESVAENSLFDHLAGYSQELQMVLLGWLFIHIVKSLALEA